MRKTSQDGGDSTSITSGFENEMKKSGAIIKTKRNSIKRKVQNFSNDNDDAVIEPLLQKDKEKPETSMQSAKYNNLLSKSKTDASGEKGTDREKLIIEGETHKPTLSTALIPTEANISGTIETLAYKPMTSNQPMHNHMHTNVFTTHDSLKSFVTTKSQILVEIDGTKQAGYSPGPLIFTTAKIHTDGKTKQMEPVQMTPVPILSTTEVGSSKSGFTTSNKTITREALNVTDAVLGLELDKNQKAISTASTQSNNLPPTKGTGTLNSLSNKTSVISITPKKEHSVIPGYSKSLEAAVSSNIAVSTVCVIQNKDSNVSSINTGTKDLVTPVQIVKTIPTSLSQATIKDDLSKRKEVTAITVPDTAIKKGTIAINEPKLNVNVETSAIETTQVYPVRSESSKAVIKDQVLKSGNGSASNNKLQRQKNSVTTDSETLPLKPIDGGSKNTTTSNTVQSINDTSKLSKIQTIPSKHPATLPGTMPGSEQLTDASQSNRPEKSNGTNPKANNTTVSLPKLSSKVPSTITLSDPTKTVPLTIKSSTSVTSNVSSKLPVNTVKTLGSTVSKVTKSIASSTPNVPSSSTTAPVSSTTNKNQQPLAPGKGTDILQDESKVVDKNNTTSTVSTPATSKPTATTSSAALVSAAKPSTSQKSDPKSSSGGSKDNKDVKA